MSFGLAGTTAEAQSSAAFSGGTHGGAQRDGAQPGPGPKGNIGELWRAEVPYDYYSFVDPANPVATNGEIFISDYQHTPGKLLSYRTVDGSSLWQWENNADSGDISTPFVSGGLAWVTTTEGNLIAIDLTKGQVAHKVSLGKPAASETPTEVGRCSSSDRQPIPTEPTVYGDKIYAATGNMVTAFALDGTSLWTKTLPDEIKHPPTPIGSSIVVTTCSASGNVVHGLKADTGAELWRYESGNTSIVTGHGSAALFTNFTGIAYELISLDAQSGQKNWS